MLGYEFMERERCSGGRPQGRCTRREALRWLGATVVAVAAGSRVSGGVDAAARPEPVIPPDSAIPSAGGTISADTSRVAGIGLAAAAVLVAGKLIRDKDRDPEL